MHAALGACRTGERRDTEWQRITQHQAGIKQFISTLTIINSPKFNPQRPQMITMVFLGLLTWSIAFAPCSILAASLPTTPGDLTIVPSQKFPGRSISYKEVQSIDC